MSWYDNLINLISLNRTKSAFDSSEGSVPQNVQFFSDRPAWLSLSKPQDFEMAARENPVVKAAINLLASSSSNGRKVAIDIKTG